MSKFPFLPEPSAIPFALEPDRAEPWLERWRSAAQGHPEAEAAYEALAQDNAGQRLLKAIFANSPLLSHCLIADIGLLPEILNTGPQAVLEKVLKGLQDEISALTDQTPVMQRLRQSRRRAAFAVAFADIFGFWDVYQATQALSDFADAAINAALAATLRQAAARDELGLAEAASPTRQCGIAILGMGKLGAGELNYSSDVDLIVIFDPEKVDYRHSRGVQQGLVRLTRDFLRLLDDRTADGYVFRTDLRLRPDPGAMPLAININSALTYYESLGQNWERAAMIKARPIAGDLELGTAFLAELRPFIWRKHLDFWAIQDVHSIKRQINAHKGGSVISVNGHNVKLGRGGIREVEFFAQTQQLIWGGRDRSAR